MLMEVKPWDDETDMKKLEECVRAVEMPGLLWGACTSTIFPFVYACSDCVGQFSNRMF